MEKYKIKTVGTALFLMILTLAGCGKGASEKAETDSDSIAARADDTPVEETVYYLTAEGIAPEGGDFVIKTGMAVKEIPAEAEGLYNQVEKDTSAEYVTYIFTLTDEDGTGVQPFIAYDFGERNIDLIQLTDSTVKVHTPQGDIHIGQSFLDVLNLPGIEASWEGYDYEESGCWYWIWEGLFFQPSHSRLSNTLIQKLFEPETAPTAADFTPENVTETISTGLPY